MIEPLEQKVSQLGPLPPQRAADPLADMSGDEYVEKARSRKRKGGIPPVLRPERHILNNVVLDAMTKTVCNEEDQQVRIDPLLGVTGRSVRVPGDADLVIINVHDLPQRQRSVPPADSDQSMFISWPMKKQQDTGAWPTIESHLQGHSPQYEVFLDEWGHLDFKERAPDWRQGCRSLRS